MDLRPRRMILYRGSLKSCNYRCSYCPFSKHPMSRRGLLRDKDQWDRFCLSLEHRAEAMEIHSLMVTPYGEALIHPWYWEGLGRLSAMDKMEAVGAQTNLSFSVEQSLKIYRQAGGKLDKLRLWATFHPEMTTVEAFGEICRKLWDSGAGICAGAVGDIRYLDAIKALRRVLPDSIYLWINKMDGFGRDYTQKERTAFEEIDPYFGRELERTFAEARLCEERLFVEGDGTMKRCNISRGLPGNWYDGEGSFPKDAFSGKEGKTVSCGRKACTCYLAYGGRDEAMNRLLFGPYPLFRIPARPKAAFLDIDKTLIKEGERRLTSKTVTDLKALARDKCRLFFATSLPYREAMRRCQEVWPLFEGGIFSGGGHVAFSKEGEMQERFLALDPKWVWALKQEREQYRFRILTYGDPRHGVIYKITLVRPKRMEWSQEETERLMRAEEMEGMKGIRWFAEGSCLEIVHKEATKAGGVRFICQSLGILPGDAAAMGDGPEDEEMMELCTSSLRGRIRRSIQ